MEPGSTGSRPGRTARQDPLETVPEALREELRHLGWLLINTPLPASFLIGKPSRWRTTVSPGQVYATVAHWRAFCQWWDERGRSSLGECTPEDLRAYALHLGSDRGVPRAGVQKALAALTRMWALDSSNPFPTGFCEPPWLSEGADDYLPAGSPAGENTTEPITPETMGPLLIWALRVVDDFADDILAAVKRKDEILAKVNQTIPTPEGLAALKDYLGRLIAAGAPLPSMAEESRTRLAATYIAYLTGASVSQVYSQVGMGPWREHLLAANGPAPILTGLSGTVDGVPWKEHIDYSEVRALKTHLATAA
ncbi:hypothetical protein [Sinomonas sp. G460-2]|uniref:hypothetical protein n=1 Tax=Sinomonas sp. G460-2 TaxID=3393464 RepID=UPI0039EF60B5